MRVKAKGTSVFATLLAAVWFSAPVLFAAPPTKPLDLQQKVSLLKKGCTLGDGLRILARAANLNIIAALPKEQNRFSFRFQKRPLGQVLDAVCEAFGMEWQLAEGSLILIAPAPAFPKGKTEEERILSLLPPEIRNYYAPGLRVSEDKFVHGALQVLNTFSEEERRQGIKVASLPDDQKAIVIDAFRYLCATMIQNNLSKLDPFAAPLTIQLGEVGGDGETFMSSDEESRLWIFFGPPLNSGGGAPLPKEVLSWLEGGEVPSSFFTKRPLRKDEADSIVVDWQGIGLDRLAIDVPPARYTCQTLLQPVSARAGITVTSDPRLQRRHLFASGRAVSASLLIQSAAKTLKALVLHRKGSLTLIPKWAGSSDQPTTLTDRVMAALPDDLWWVAFRTKRSDVRLTDLLTLDQWKVLKEGGTLVWKDLTDEQKRHLWRSECRTVIRDYLMRLVNDLELFPRAAIIRINDAVLINGAGMIQVNIEGGAGWAVSIR